MLCPACGRYTVEERTVCPYCGRDAEPAPMEVDEEELMRFRQGRHLRQPEQPAEEVVRPRRSGGASRSFEDPTPPLTPEATGEIYGSQESLSNTGCYYYDDESEENIRMQVQLEELHLRASDREEPVRVRGIKQKRYRRRMNRYVNHQRMVNWAYVDLAIVALLIVLALGFLLYLRNTVPGQVLVARWGYDATAAAMWTVGEECYDRGDVHQAIEYFVTARAKDEESDTLSEANLLLLGEAYEAQGDLPAAEEVYACIYTKVDAKSVSAYRAQVRVLREQGRDAEAAALLLTAYQQTGETSFRSQRLEILPAIPTADVTAGYYTQRQTVTLIQQQEYSIVYALDPLAVLPEDGIPYEAPLVLGEGEHDLRAVAVYGDLISDPLKITYQIYMPTPLQPDANLAPGTYSTPRTNVRLWPKQLSDEELEKNPGYAATLDDETAQDITIYYTIDGSIPDADSPIYTGEPIVMATNGYNWLRAVSVNGYGKQGNMKEIEIKLNLRTRAPKVYCMEDVIADLKLGSTAQDVFLRKYGSGTATESVWLYGVDGECVRYTYNWGYATFMKTKTGWFLAEIYLTTNELTLPRGTTIGMKEAEITAKYKDFGQVTSPSGNRGLYDDIKSSDKGKIYVQEGGGKIIRYRTDTTDMHIWQMDYILNDAGVCTAVHWIFEN